MNLQALIIIFISFAGFLISFYVHHKKEAGEKLVCPLGAKCELVTHSKYSKIFGIELEFLGMAYYAFMALSYAAFIVEPLWGSSWFGFMVVWASISSFGFTLYLLYVQICLLREWCSWCLFSAVISTAIFVIATFFGL